MADGRIGPFNAVDFYINGPSIAEVDGRLGWDSTDGFTVGFDSVKHQFFTTPVGDNNIRVGAAFCEVSYTNDGAGTANKKFCILTTSGTVKTALTSSTDGVIGPVVSGAGTSGNPSVGIAGIATVTFDGSATAGNYVQISATNAGEGHDAGSTYPTTGQVLGRVIALVSGTDYSVALFGPEIRGGSGGGGSVSIASPYLYDGADYYFPAGVKVYPPGPLTWIGDNMGGSPASTITTGANGDMVLQVAGGGGAGNLVGQRTAISSPAGSWTIDVKIYHSLPGNNFALGGMYLYDSVAVAGNNRIVSWDVVSNNINNSGAQGQMYLHAGYWNSATSFNTDALVRWALVTANPITWRIVNDGTDINLYVSSDGYSFGQAILTVPKGFWLTGSGYPTHAGFFGERAGSDAVITALSYKQS